MNIHQKTIFSIYLSLTILLTIGFSQKRLHNPEITIVKQQLKNFLPQIITNLTTQYQLDTETDIQLNQSIQKTVTSALQQPNITRNLTIASNTHKTNKNLLKLLLAQPPYQTTFTQHLNPTQLQNYIKFINN